MIIFYDVIFLFINLILWGTLRLYNYGLAGDCFLAMTEKMSIFVGGYEARRTIAH